MNEYLIMFIFSIIFCILSQKFSNKKISKIFDLLAILTPAIVAGGRSLEIGTDINVYGNYMHYVASNFNALHFFSIFGYSDILFSSFTIIVGGLFKNIHTYLFLLQLLNCCLVYKACKNYKDNIPVWLSYLLFLLTLYFRQLNLLRQGLAISFSILAFSYLLKDKNKKFWLFTVLSTLTHISGILLVLIYIIKKISERKKDKKVLFALMYFMLISIFVFFMPLLRIITSIGILPAKYTIEYFSKYLNPYHELDNLGTLFKLLWCVVTLFVASKKSVKDNIKDFNFLFHIVFIDFIFWNMNLYIYYIDRVSFYFGYAYMIFLLPQFKNAFKNDLLNRGFYYALLIISFALYWYFRFVVQNAGAVYPYIHY